jgi:RNA polymerase sigma-70 factor (ECF subfamily)
MKSFRGTSSFSTWLYRIALNVCRDEIKRRARRPYAASSLATDDQPDPLAAIPSDEPGPDEVAETHERRRLVQEAIARLPEHHRTPLVLRDLEGLSYEQIGEVLGAAVGTVKSRINRARLALKAELAPHMELFR